MAKADEAFQFALKFNRGEAMFDQHPVRRRDSHLTRRYVAS
jgi:hypothetical protein